MTDPLAPADRKGSPVTVLLVRRPVPDGVALELPGLAEIAAREAMREDTR